MQARHTLPVFILVAFFPFLLKSQCSLSVNLGADVSVCRGASKTFTATPVGGTPAYTYLWSDGSRSSAFTVSSAGNFGVTVTDANGCTAQDAVVVSMLDTSVFTLEIRAGDTAQFVSCINKNVIVKAQPDGVVPVANFTWSTGETALQFINAYAAGTYAVTVTAVNGCQSKKSIVVTQNTTPPNVSIGASPNTATLNCYTNQIILDGSSTTNGVTFLWNTGQTNSAIAATTAGIYTLTARSSEFGGNGCTATTQIEVKNSTPLVNLGPDRTIPSGQTTILTAAVSRGTGPYTYTWSNGLGTTPSVTVGASGIYLVTVTDPIGCTSTDNIQITVQSNPIVNAGADATTCKNVAKTFTASVSSGGVAPYTYLWSNAATTPSISVKTAGNYSVTVTDANGATGSDLVVLTTLDTAVFELQIRPDTALFLSCNNKNLILKAQPDGVLPVADYTWSTGASAIQFITVYETGTYGVTVTGANGCKSSSSVVVSSSLSTPNISISPIPANATLNCNVSQIFLDAISTTPGATYTWNTGATTSSIAATTAGIYTVTAKNPEFGGGNGCTATAQIEVKSSTPSVDLGANRTITSGQTATLTATITKGVAPFTYAWSNSLPATPSVSVSTAGTYRVTITDANGCTATDAVVVTVSSNNNLIVNVGADATTCKNVAKTFTASVSNGVAPYSYLWSNAATTSSISVKTAGNYSVTVTDATGATGSDVVVLTTLDTATFQLEIRPDTALYLSCNNKNLILKAQPDGVLPVADFMWNIGAVSQQFITVYETGIYAVTVTAVNGCKSSSSVVVTSNTTPPNVSIVPLPANATLNCNTPQVILDAVSTTPSVTLRWNTGAITSSIAATTAGIYTVTASFPSFNIGNGCTATAQVEVKNSTPTVDLGADRTIASGQSATLTATITKGVAPFTYAWSNSLPSTPSVSVSTAGTYRVTITDANGCTATDAVVVTVSSNNNLIVNVGADATTCKNVAKTFTASVSNGVAPYTYLWSNAATTSSISVKTAGNYSVTVTDATGATGSDVVVLTTLDTATFQLEIRPDTALYLSCNNKNLILKAQPDGVLPVADFMWSTGAASQQFITVYETGMYAVTVTAVNGCKSSSSVVVTSNTTLPNVSILPLPANATLNCNTPQVILDAVSTTPSVTLRWNTGATTSSIGVTTAGIYTVTASFPTFNIGNGCTATAQVEVKNSTPSVDLGADRTIASGQSATLTATIAKGVAPFTYAWSTNATTPSVLVSTAGTYRVTITDANGCTATDAVVVSSTGTCTLNLSVSQTNNFCFGASSGSIFIGYVSGGIAPYQYSFDGGSTFSDVRNKYNLVAGTYVVIVKDANQCTGTRTIVITENPKINFTATATTTCGSTGSITISNVSGGTGAPFQFAITNLPIGHPYAGAWVTNTVFNNLPANTYFVKVRDAGSCSNQPPISVVVGSISGISATIAGNATVCFSTTTTLTATPTGGNGPFTYKWIKPDASSATMPTLQGGVGSYFVTITDANGCSAVATKTVTGVLNITAAITGNTALCTASSTTLTATSLSGTPPFNFVWSTGQTGTTTNNTTGVSVTVGAGNYCVTVTDATGCSSTLCKTVTHSTLAAAINSTPSGASTTLTVTPSYGLAPYLYTWSNGSTANTITVGAGTYTVTVTDAGGCTVVKSATVTAPSGLTLALESTVNVKCNGEATGKIVTIATGGTGTKVFTINNFATTQTDGTFSNLAAGTYTIQARDGNGTLSNIVTATLTQGAVINFTTAKTSNYCNGSTGGTITVSGVTGGTSPYTYSKDNGLTWIAERVFTNLAADNYSVKVKDANTCTSSRQIVTVEQPTGFSYATIQDDPTCSNTTDGKITVRYTTGGNGAPYQFSKSNGGSWQTDSVFANLPAGTYYIKIRDSKGCNSATRIIAVAQPAPVTFATTVGDVTCGYTSNGVIGVVSVAGGSAPYQYSRGSSFQVSSNFTGLIAGTYPIRVQDKKGCMSSIRNTVVKNACPIVTPLIRIEPTQFIPIVITGVSPNPASDELNLDVRSLKEREQQFDFINVLGKTMISEKRHLEPGANRVSFDVSSLLPGTYFIQTLGTGEGKNQPRLFIKM